MRFGEIHITGIGTAGTDRVSTADAVTRGWWSADERDRSGLLSISVAGTTPAPDLAVEAAGRALEQAGRPDGMSALFHTNVHPQGPDGWSAPHYINRRTINRPVMSVEVRNGCIGFFSALQLAASHLTVVPGAASALITAADNFGTPAVDRWWASKQYVLADGGGAVVLAKSGGFATVLAVGAVSDPELELKHRSGEEMFPPGMTIGRPLNFRERMEDLQRRALAGTLPPLGDFGSILIDVTEATLKEAGITLDDVTRVVHDGFTRTGVRDMFLDPLGLDEERGIWEFTRGVGHAGPLDALRGLEYLWRSRAVTAGDHVLLAGCAPGMEAACAIVRITQAA